MIFRRHGLGDRILQAVDPIARLRLDAQSIPFELGTVPVVRGAHPSSILTTWGTSAFSRSFVPLNWEVIVDVAR